MARIEGRGVVLRPLRSADLDALVELANDPVIGRYTFVPQPYTLREARSFLVRARADARGRRRLNLAIAEPRSDALVGVVGLQDIDREHRAASLGYWVGAPHRGRGFAKAAVGAMTRHGFERLGLVRVQAKVLPRNLASARVLEANRFQLEGRLRRDVQHQGRWKDTLLYARTTMPR
jgi:RimJ/RimL family protein N-acetyltransferase